MQKIYPSLGNIMGHDWISFVSTIDTSKWKLLHSTENDKLELRILTYLLFSKEICHFVKIRNNVIKKSSLPDQNEIYVLVLAAIT